MAVSAPVKLCEYASSASVTTSGAQASTGTAAVGSFLLATLGGAANTADQQISDSNGHTWTLTTVVTLGSGALSTLRFAYTVVTTAIDTSDTFTFTRTGSNSLVAAVYAITGVDTTSPVVDSDGNSTTSSVTTLSTPALTSVGIGDLTFLAFQAAVDKASSLAATAGWSGGTVIDTRISTGTNPRFVGDLYRQESAAGSVTPGATWTTGSTGSVASIALRAAAAVPKTGTASGSWAFAGAAVGDNGVVTTVSNTAEGTPGATVTTTNSAGPDQFTNVTGGSSSFGSITYSSAQKYNGATSIAFNSTAASVQLFVQLTPPAASTSYARFYYYSGSDAATADIFMPGGSISTAVQVTGSGASFRILDASGTVRATSSSSVAQNAWVRFEVDSVAGDSSNGSVVVRYYATPGSTTPTETLTASSISTLTAGGTAFGTQRFGRRNPTAAGTMYLDEMAVSPDAQPGPIASTPKTGTGSGTFAFVGTAAGTRAPKATATGTFTFVGTASGKRTPKATGTGAWSFTGTAAGSRAPKGAAAGTFTFTGAATGSRSPQAAASGTLDWNGAALGTAPAVGVADGVAAGLIVWVGSATGSAPVIEAAEGTASGITEWQSAAVGQLPKVGSGSGLVTWSGAAEGARPKVGDASGLTTYAGTATGQRTPKATAAGSAAYAGAAVGKRAPRAAAVGNVAWSGVAAGKKAVTGVAAGSTVWVGAATGINELAVTPIHRTLRVAAEVRVRHIGPERRTKKVGPDPRILVVRE